MDFAEAMESMGGRGDPRAEDFLNFQQALTMVTPKPLLSSTAAVT
jgi:hypothetical protein